MKRILFFTPFLVAFIQNGNLTRENLKKRDWSALKSIVLTRAKSAKEIDVGLSALSEMKRGVEVCEQQLELKSVPLKCYEVLETEKRLGLLERGSSQDMYSFLENLCEDAVRGIRNLEDLRFEALEKRTIGPKCRTALAKRFDILRYKSVESNPRAIFQLRWN